MSKPVSALIIASILTFAPAVAPAQDDQGKRLYDAVLFQDVPQLATLLGGGADPNHMQNNRSLLAWAAQGGSVDVVKVLLEAGADPNIVDAVGHTPLMRAVETKQVDIISALLAANADPDIATAEGRTAAMLAVETGDKTIVQILADAGADFNARDIRGNTALMNAVNYSVENLAEIVAVLGKAGADMNAGGGYSTPLFYAVEQGDEALVDALLKAGADPDVKAGEGNVPLLSAFSYPKIAGRLIEAGADPNAKNRWGESALFTAIDNGTLEQVKMLIQAGADVNLKSDDGQTPLKRANSLAREEMAALLTEHGATESGVTTQADTAGATAASGTRTEASSIPTFSTGEGTLAGFPMISTAQVFIQDGPSLMYFSSAPLPDVLDFYTTELNKLGFEKAAELTDNTTYAALKYLLDGAFYTMSIVEDTSTDPPRVSVSVNAHGKYSARKLPRPEQSEAVFEEDHTAIYVIDDDPKTAAARILPLLQADGWQGAINDLNELQTMDLSKEDTRLSVMIQVAPAQNNRTTLTYSVILKN